MEAEEPDYLTQDQCVEDFTNQMTDLIAQIKTSSKFCVLEGLMQGQHVAVIGVMINGSENQATFRPLGLLLHSGAYKNIELPDHAKWDDGRLVCGQLPDGKVTVRSGPFGVTAGRGPFTLPRLGKKQEIN